MRQISRDPFAREDLVRVQHTHPPQAGCSWCGQTKQTKTGKPVLYEYGISPDGDPGVSRIRWIKGMFCSKGCFRSYHDC